LVLTLIRRRCSSTAATVAVVRSCLYSIDFCLNKIRHLRDAIVEYGFVRRLLDVPHDRSVTSMSKSRVLQVHCCTPNLVIAEGSIIVGRRIAFDTDRKWKCVFIIKHCVLTFNGRSTGKVIFPLKQALY